MPPRYLISFFRRYCAPMAMSLRLGAEAQRLSRRVPGTVTLHVALKAIDHRIASHRSPFCPVSTWKRCRRTWGEKERITSCQYQICYARVTRVQHAKCNEKNSDALGAAARAQKVTACSEACCVRLNLPPPQLSNDFPKALKTTQGS